jgi:hypothetical protein
MAFYRSDTQEFVSLTVGELMTLLNDAAGTYGERADYLLFPNSVGNLSIVSPDERRHTLGFIDLAKNRVRWFRIEAPEAEENVWYSEEIRVDVEDGTAPETNSDPTFPVPEPSEQYITLNR